MEEINVGSESRLALKWDSRTKEQGNWEYKVEMNA